MQMRLEECNDIIMAICKQQQRSAVGVKNALSRLEFPGTEHCYYTVSRTI